MLIKLLKKKVNKNYTYCSLLNIFSSCISKKIKKKMTLFIATEYQTPESISFFFCISSDVLSAYSHLNVPIKASINLSLCRVSTIFYASFQKRISIQSPFFFFFLLKFVTFWISRVTTSIVLLFIL